jgi:pSer/pThr/pTyr-binding forkhead associated (FHA) protein
MKLVFPGGEHPQVLLGPGVNRVGSDPESNVVIDRPGVRPQHCLLHVTGTGVMLEVPQSAEVCVNGRVVDGLISLRAGDAVAFNGVQARLAAIEPAAAVRKLSDPWHASSPANDDPGVTAVRPVAPKFVLRGTAGRAFGRSIPLAGTLTVGRGPECSLRLDEPGLSRAHARLLATDHGVLVEDVGSSNGTFINGNRVLRGEARVGDEIGFDTMRFQVLAYGAQEVVAKSMRARSSTASRRGWFVVVALAAVAVAVAVFALM